MSEVLDRTSRILIAVVFWGLRKALQDRDSPGILEAAANPGMTHAEVHGAPEGQSLRGGGFMAGEERKRVVAACLLSHTNTK